MSFAVTARDSCRARNVIGRSSASIAVSEELEEPISCRRLDRILSHSPNRADRPAHLLQVGFATRARAQGALRTDRAQTVTERPRGTLSPTRLTPRTRDRPPPMARVPPKT